MLWRCGAEMTEQRPVRQEAAASIVDKAFIPPEARFQAALDLASKFLERDPREGAALAIAATRGFVRNMGWDLHFLAPLGEALEIALKGIDPETLPHVRRAIELVEDRSKPPPPIDYFKGKSISRKDASRIMASVAVDYHRLCKVPLPEALRMIVGRNPAAARKLEDFRDYLRRTKSGPKREFYDHITQEIRDLGLDPHRAARAALNLYRIQIGEKP